MQSDLILEIDSVGASKIQFSTSEFVNQIERDHQALIFDWKLGHFEYTDILGFKFSLSASGTASVSAPPASIEVSPVHKYGSKNLSETLSEDKRPLAIGNMPALFVIYPDDKSGAELLTDSALARCQLDDGSLFSEEGTADGESISVAIVTKVPLASTNLVHFRQLQRHKRISEALEDQLFCKGSLLFDSLDRQVTSVAKELEGINIEHAVLGSVKQDTRFSILLKHLARASASKDPAAGRDWFRPKAVKAFLAKQAEHKSNTQTKAHLTHVEEIRLYFETAEGKAFIDSLQNGVHATHLLILSFRKTVV
jgi:hypothetical protein